MKVATIAVGPLQENCHLVVDEATSEAALIDPGAEDERLLAAVQGSGARLAAIWLTHAHFDHVGAVGALRRATGAPIHLHPADAPLYARAADSALVYGLDVEQPPPADVALADGDVLALGALRFDVWHAPGHAPGHVVLVGHGAAFVGDCLFAGSVGRTDLPLADPRQLAATLERLATLPPETVVYPGHGPTTTIGAELASNPFLNGSIRLVRG
ncbi:MAG TPA: MBL fold metallo-hydrolase [Gemmatimonadaceae bacterium]|nr:MBL fold metallo-hydrolase [Gemmatimonadaceae bacterium]